MTISLLLSLLLGVPIGIYSAVKQYSKFDYFFTGVAFIGSAMPTFFFALLLILVFSVFPVFLADTMPWIPRLPPGLKVAVRPYDVASWLPTVQPRFGAGSTPAPADARGRVDVLHDGAVEPLRALLDARGDAAGLRPDGQGQGPVRKGGHPEARPPQRA